MLRILIFAAFVLTLFGTIVAIKLVEKTTHQNAVLNEYEFLLADCFDQNKDLKNQLGVFYVPHNKNNGRLSE